MTQYTSPPSSPRFSGAPVASQIPRRLPTPQNPPASINGPGQSSSTSAPFAYTSPRPPPASTAAVPHVHRVHSERTDGHARSSSGAGIPSHDASPCPFSATMASLQGGRMHSGSMPPFNRIPSSQEGYIRSASASTIPTGHGSSHPPAARVAASPQGARPHGTSPPNFPMKRKREVGDDFEARRNFGLMSRWVDPPHGAHGPPTRQNSTSQVVHPTIPRPTPTVVIPAAACHARAPLMCQPPPSQVQPPQGVRPSSAQPLLSQAQAARPPPAQTLPSHAPEGHPPVVAPQALKAPPPTPTAPSPLSPKSKEGEIEYLRYAKETYEWITRTEEEQKGTVLRQMIVSALIGLLANTQAREQMLIPIDGDTVRNAIYELLNAPNQVVSFPALRSVAKAAGQGPLERDNIVDDEGNPYTEYILTFIDSFLVLFRPVSTAIIPLKVGIGQSGENDETDQKAFGALTATSLASRVLILIPHAHLHILRAVWFALTFLSAAYAGSKRGVAVKFLLDRLSEEWTTREEKRAKVEPVPVADQERKDARVDAVWLRRARRVDELRQEAEKRTRSGLSLATIWAEMKGLSGALPMGRPGPIQPQPLVRSPPRALSLSQSPPTRPSIPTRSPPRPGQHAVQPTRSPPRQRVHSYHLNRFLPRPDGLATQPSFQMAHPPRQPASLPYRTLHLTSDTAAIFHPAQIDNSTTSPTQSHSTLDSSTPSPKLSTLNKGLGVDEKPRQGTPMPIKTDLDTSPITRISLSPY